jgi:uncharacterized protein YdeI (YjbR/CyaY-like superfamily)
MGQADAEQVEFATRQDWRDWLRANHETSQGVFVVYFKKSARKPGPATSGAGSGVGPATSGAGSGVGPAYEDLIEEALCFGWIDGTARSVDDTRTSLYFCPRRKGGVWAASNKARVERLRAAGLMTAAGEAVIDRAKADGSWTVLDRSEALELPNELAAALARRTGGLEAFDALRPGMRKQLIYQVDSAKRVETRERRAEDIARNVCES